MCTRHMHYASVIVDLRWVKACKAVPGYMRSGHLTAFPQQQSPPLGIGYVIPDNKHRNRNRAAQKASMQVSRRRIAARCET